MVVDLSDKIKILSAAKLTTTAYKHTANDSSVGTATQFDTPEMITWKNVCIHVFARGDHNFG